MTESVCRNARSWRDRLPGYIASARWCLAALLAFVLSGLCPASVRALDGTWEFSPYRVRVWVLMEPSPFLPGRLQRDVRESVLTGVLTDMEYGWQTVVEPAPAHLQMYLSADLETMTFEALPPPDAKLPGCDKLYLVRIRLMDDAFEIATVEWDVPTRLPSVPLISQTQQLEMVPQLAMRGVLESFRPLAKIERLEGRDYYARIHSAGLVTAEKSPLLVEPGQYLHPVIRRNQKNGEPLPGGILAPYWTYLEPESRESSVLRCRLFTAYASPIPAKGGQRVERLALLVQRRFPHTDVLLQTRRESTAKLQRGAKRPPPVIRPLPDYEVFAKVAKETDTTFLGLTDWRGCLRLPVDNGPLRILYVRNGGQFLARLPVLSGERREASVDVFDDDPRLIAEARVRALQTRLMDAEARRELLARRIRSLLDRKKYEDAEKLLEDLKQLPQRSQLVRELEETRRSVPSVQGTTKVRMEKLFNDANKLLSKFLNPELPVQLQKEINSARAGIRPRAAESPAETAEEKSSPAAPVATSTAEKTPAGAGS